MMDTRARGAAPARRAAFELCVALLGNEDPDVSLAAAEVLREWRREGAPEPPDPETP